MNSPYLHLATLACAGLLAVPSVGLSATDQTPAQATLNQLGNQKDIAAILGLPEAGRPAFVIELAQSSDWQIYFQSADEQEIRVVRQAASRAGLLGTRVFAGRGDLDRIHLADNLAGAVVVSPSAAQRVDEAEVMRVLHPEGHALINGRKIVKPAPPGIDHWSHPYHAPDNNPQSTDNMARAPYLTQFLADPKFSPMPEVSVAAGGRIFKAFGHIAHKANQNPMLNTLMGINAYNGIHLWKRPLREGFMIHRNTMIATPDTLFLADDESCKLIDPATGQTRDEIIVPAGLADGPVWKWMALENGILYALVGGKESPIYTKRSDNPALGHWPWGMWDGHDYKKPDENFGYGRTFLAIEPETKRILWSHREDDYIDSRGVCMKNGRIFFYCPDQFLACLDTRTAQVAWRNSDGDLLAAIGSNEKAQHYVTGYATTTYIKCNDDYLFFAGPQRRRLVVASARDGKRVWDREPGNLQLVLRDDGFYAAGPSESGAKIDYATGEIMARLPNRRACTRATGSIDSIFFRTPGGTVRVETESNQARHIAPMRPPCQDGVLISEGLLFWGPWMCGCQLSLYGHISLAPAGDFEFEPKTADSSRLTLARESSGRIAPFASRPNDWPGYLHDSRRSGASSATLPRALQRRWTFDVPARSMPTAPIVVGDTVFFGDRTGALRALNDKGELLWEAYTGGAISFSPALAEGRIYVGSGDGRVYAFEAATGKPLWDFRVAPAERLIPVYGQLMSTWPVAGGVAVEDGVVYAAAGIAHYDGTHVVALDGISGQPKWYNSSSGTLSDQAMSGISLQGNLRIEGKELRFSGGGIYQSARYDLRTGECLNDPHHGVNSRYQTACYAYYPDYAQYLSLNHTRSDGTTLSYEASYEGSRHTELQLLAPAKPGAGAPKLDPKEARRAAPVGKPAKRAVLWKKDGNRYQSLVVTSDAVLAAGQPGKENKPEQGQPFLLAFDVSNGAELWRKPLPAPAVKGGAAIDDRARVVVALQNGQVICFTPEELRASR